MEGIFETEDVKLIEAVWQSYNTGTLTPLLKEELKYRIQTRRMEEGLSEVDSDSDKVPEGKDYQLRPDELERIERRKEQNRKAASKFRLKQKAQTERLQKECQELRKRNQRLRDEIVRLTNEKLEVQSAVLEALGCNPPTQDHAQCAYKFDAGIISEPGF